MKMTNVFINTFLIFAVTTTMSCADKSIADFKDKASYITYMQGKSESDLKVALTKDTAYLSKRIDSVINISFYESFYLSPIENENDELEKAPKFALPLADSIKRAFELYTKTLQYKQIHQVPYSEFRFTTFESSPFLKENRFKYFIKEASVGKNKMSADAIKLTTPDSLAVQITYNYATNFDAIEINRTAKKVKYQEFEIEVDKIDKGMVILHLPAKLNAKILGRQAVNKNAKLMNSNAYDSFANMALSYNTISDLNLLKTTLVNSYKAESKEKALAVLNNIPDDIFETLAQVNAFNGDIMKVDDNAEDSKIMAQMSRINKKYIGILDVKYQEIQMNFPDVVEKVYVFIETRKATLTANQIIKPSDVEVHNYHIYYDKKVGKYGIIDKKGNIIINAAYDEFRYVDNLYFESMTTEAAPQKQTYYLDVPNKQLIKIPSGITYLEMLDKDYTVFINEKRQAGLLKNNKEEVLPFVYRNIEHIGNVFLAHGTKNEKSYIDFFNIDGAKLSMDSITGAEENFHGIIVTNSKQKDGMINKNGKIVIPMIYNNLLSISDTIPLFAYNERGSGYGATPTGLMTADGKKITPDNYYGISNYSEGLIKFKLWDKQRGVGKGGFLNAQGQTVLPPIYDDVKDFNGDFAFVEMNGKYGLINKQGKLVVTFSHKPNASYKSDGFGKEITYKIDDKFYDYKGSLIKEKKQD